MLTRRLSTALLFVTALLGAPGASAGPYAGFEDFSSGDSKWAYAFRFPALTSGTNGAFTFRSGVLEFTKGTGMGSRALGWDGDGVKGNSDFRTAASFDTSWVAEVTPTLQHRPGPNAFAAIGFEIAIAPNAYTEVTLQRYTDGVLRIFTETNSPTTGIARVTIPETSDVRLRVAWNATTRIITVAYSIDGGATYSTLRTLPITDWPVQPTGGFLFELLGYSTSGTAVEAGEMTLDNFSLTTVPADFPRLGNLSVRNLTAAGNRTLIVGFTVEGAGSRPLVIRAVSETLGRVFGVPNVVSDVDLTLYRELTRLRDAATQAPGLVAAAARVGAFAVDAAASDAAVAAQLFPGSYSVHAVPATNAVRPEGATLVEVYEDGLAGTRLTNLSARTELGTEPLIVGFVVYGPQPARVLVRAVGPSLAAFGLTGTAADPRLSLIRQSDGQTLAQNEDWTSEMASSFARAGAFPLITGSKDAALVIDLPAGAYTVRLQNASAAAGIVLAELYQLP
jgi:hypothetical protein